MLAITLRVMPWRLRLSRSSLVRVTVTVLAAASTATDTSGRVVNVRRPWGPSTETVLPETVAFTPSGRGIDFFPMRDIRPSKSANGAQHLAAHVLLAAAAIAQDALGRRDDADAQTVEGAR